MNLASLTSAALKKLIGLLEQKEDLQAQVAGIDAQLSVYERGGAVRTVPGKPGRKAGSKAATGRRAARGSVKTAIIDLIKGAGSEGITVKDISSKLGTKYNRVFTWFYNTGKKIKEIKKAAPGKYVWAESAARFMRPSPAPKPTPKPKPRPTIAPKAEAKQAAPTKPKAAKPGVSKDRIIELLKGAGKEGIAAKDVAAKLGVKTQRVYVWFGATGKTVKEIKKVAPAKYAWVG